MDHQPHGVQNIPFAAPTIHGKSPPRGLPESFRGCGSITWPCGCPKVSAKHPLFPHPETLPHRTGPYGVRKLKSILVVSRRFSDAGANLGVKWVVAGGAEFMPPRFWGRVAGPHRTRRVVRISGSAKFVSASKSDRCHEYRPKNRICHGHPVDRAGGCAVLSQ